MKKKLLCVLILSASMLCSCGHEQQASDKALTCANKTVEAVEKYLNYDATYSVVSDITGSMYNEMKYVDDLDKSAPNRNADWSIQLDILSISTSLTSDNYYSTDETYNDVKEKLDKLKEDIKKYD